MKTLQYQLSNGTWVDIKDSRKDEFLDLCVQFNSDINSRDEAISTMEAGKNLLNDRGYWYAYCRIFDEEADKIRMEKMRIQRLQNMIKVDCGHLVIKGQVMTGTIGTSCADCYDRMSY